MRAMMSLKAPGRQTADGALFTRDYIKINLAPRVSNKHWIIQFAK